MQPGHRAVVVDDDDGIRELLVHVLQQTGLEVHSADSGASALDLVREVDPDLVTLDLMLPDMDGTEVCRRIREFSNAYIMMITGRSDEIDRLVGLELGADEYLSKPFSPREVRARSVALLRRPRLGAPVLPSAAPDGGDRGSFDAGGGLVLDAAHHTAALDGVPLPLTPVEVDLLAALASRPGHAWSRAEIVREVWQGDFIESDFLVDVQIGNLRRKVKKASGDREWISTVSGSGYRFDPA